MFVVSGALFILFTIWEWKFASHPVMPKRVLNKALFCSIAIDFGYYFSGYIGDTYMSSWVYVIKDWSVCVTPEISYRTRSQHECC
jgi:hypothetical protein